MRGGLIDIHERACAFFQEQLRRPEAAHAREYLASRGLTPEQIAEFRIGYAPESGFLLRDALRSQFGRRAAARVGTVFVEGKKPVVSCQWSGLRNRASRRQPASPTTDNPSQPSH